MHLEIFLLTLQNNYKLKTSNQCYHLLETRPLLWLIFIVLLFSLCSCRQQSKGTMVLPGIFVENGSFSSGWSKTNNLRCLHSVTGQFDEVAIDFAILSEIEFEKLHSSAEEPIEMKIERIFPETTSANATPTGSNFIDSGLLGIEVTEFTLTRHDIDFAKVTLIPIVNAIVFVRLVPQNIDEKARQHLNNQNHNFIQSLRI